MLNPLLLQLVILLLFDPNDELSSTPALVQFEILCAPSCVVLLMPLLLLQFLILTMLLFNLLLLHEVDNLGVGVEKQHKLA